MLDIKIASNEDLVVEGYVFKLGDIIVVKLNNNRLISGAYFCSDIKLDQITIYGYIDGTYELTHAEIDFEAIKQIYKYDNEYALN